MTLPLALATAGWTVVGAVGGAVVGASAGGMTDWLLGLRKESADAKAGARLVAGDIASAESQLEVAERTGEWWAFYGHPISSWDRYRDVLAVRLSNNDWEAVAQGVTSLESLRQQLPQSPRYAAEVKDQGFVRITNPASLTELRREAAKAFNALAKLAGHPPEGELIDRSSAAQAADVA